MRRNKYDIAMSRLRNSIISILTIIITIHFIKYLRFGNSVNTFENLVLAVTSLVGWIIYYIYIYDIYLKLKNKFKNNKLRYKLFALVFKISSIFIINELLLSIIDPQHITFSVHSIKGKSLTILIYTLFQILSEIDIISTKYGVYHDILQIACGTILSNYILYGYITDIDIINLGGTIIGQSIYFKHIKDLVTVNSSSQIIDITTNHRAFYKISIT